MCIVSWERRETRRKEEEIDVEETRSKHGTSTLRHYFNWQSSWDFFSSYSWLSSYNYHLPWWAILSIPFIHLRSFPCHSLNVNLLLLILLLNILYSGSSCSLSLFFSFQFPMSPVWQDECLRKRNRNDMEEGRWNMRRWNKKERAVNECSFMRLRVRDTVSEWQYKYSMLFLTVPL